MTFPTYAGDEHSEVASTRMLLMPSSVRAGQPFLGRITRHELSHVAIGVRDDGSPTWVSEGIAEYLGAREMPVHDRHHPDLCAASAPQTVDATMPASKRFNDSDQEWHYALSWMACDYIADTFGESRLWELVDAMHNGGAGDLGRRPGPRARAGARLRQPRARPPGSRADPRTSTAELALSVEGGQFPRS